MPVVLNEHSGFKSDNKSSASTNMRQSIAWNLLKYFEETPKTESAFYLRFQTLDKEDSDFLKMFYRVEEDWQLFSRICKFWNVNQK